MFTGIVETVGGVDRVEPAGEGRRLTIAAPWSAELVVGESVAVDGCCLTVVERGRESFVVEAVEETVRRTIVGEYAPGRRVHLERALRVGDRLSGHFVQGHVDRVGRVAALERHADNRYITIDLPAPEDLPLVAPQGSIAVNGVSLTVLEKGTGDFRVAIVPHTWRVTALSDLPAGTRVNVEYDVIARYVNEVMRLH